MQVNYKFIAADCPYFWEVKKIFLIIIITAHLAKGQDINVCKQRFNQYLNYHGQLNNAVHFDQQSIRLKNASGKNDWCVYANEIKALAAYFESCSSAEILSFMNKKACQKLSAKQLDSLSLKQKKSFTKNKQSNKPLAGLKVAIDAGHFGTNLKDAAAEQKFLKIVRENNADTLLIFESLLTFQTASLTKMYLEEMGAEVFLSRMQANYTSFNCSFDDWMKNHRQRTLDSLFVAGTMNKVKLNQLSTCNAYKFFWDFFREFELANRAKKINDFQPDITVIIHYNVNEKNAPWKKTSDKNFTMTFMPGAFTKNDFDKADGKANFLRLLISNQLNQSERLSALTVNHFSKDLSITKAQSADATYLAENCLKTGSEGVYCRNLYLCRKVNSVMVYGEALYQDNEKEIEMLRKNDLNVNGMQTNLRVQEVAKCYFDAVMDYFK